MDSVDAAKEGTKKITKHAIWQPLRPPYTPKTASINFGMWDHVLDLINQISTRSVFHWFRSPNGPLLQSLHWLPVQQRICFKLAKLCYLVTSFQQPGYLSDLISPYSQSRSLRSSTQKFLSVLPHNLDTAARRFSVAAPRLWNSLPLNCRTAPSVNTFKTRLKTFLFVSA